MEQRLDYTKLGFGGVQAMYKLQKYVEDSGIEHSLIELVAPFYAEHERAALAWTEAVTLISESHASDEDYAAARSQFSEHELVNLTIAIIAINGWNRLAISFRAEPGKYEPQQKQATS